MIKHLLKYFARRSHDVRLQAGLAAFHGLVDVFGIIGAIAIINKLRKLQKRKAVKRA